MLRRFYFFLLFLFLSTASLLAQDTGKNRSNQIDTPKLGFIQQLNKLGANEAKRSILKYKESKDAIKQERLLEQIKETTLKSKVYMKQVLDTVVIIRELNQIKYWNKIAGDGVFTNTGISHTFRNLATTSKLLNELLKRVKITKKQIDLQEKDLVNFRFRIDSLSSDPSLYTFSSDTVITKEYITKMMVVVKQIGPIDTALKQSISNIKKMQYHVDVMANQLSSRIEEIDLYQKSLSSTSFKREFKNLGDHISFVRPLKEIVYYSFKKGELILAFYLQNNMAKVFSLMLLIAIVTVF
ncbi:MAG: hypothetical protein WC622_15275 [Pedobacter sp.]|jgi:hypothetical protein|uniref:hypothetical protein n=1 Tax=Pedobacter sp. TaxID=1411316 RepID=UPI00356849A5